MYTIQRLTTCSTRVRKTKNSIARDLNKEERPLATLWPALKVCKRKGSTIHFGLPFTDHLVCRCAPITWVYRGVGWGGVGRGGVVWGGMLTFIASGKHCREYGEGVGCGGVTVHCQRQTLSMVRWRVVWGGVGWDARVHCQWQTLSTVRWRCGMGWPCEGIIGSMWPWDLASLNSEVI